MILTVAAILAYRRSVSGDEEDENLDWKERLVKDLRELRHTTLGRCYQADENHHATMADEKTADGSDHAEQPSESPREAQHLTDQPVPSLDTATTFRDDVRNEWIDALFGPGFLQNMEPGISKGPQKGLGLAKVAPFVAYQTRLPPLPPEAPATEKLGISIARLALGLYVRRIEPGSEAWCAGVLPNSVLVSINGMSLLAEPSKQALERLWQYEGYSSTAPDDHDPHHAPNPPPPAFPPRRQGSGFGPGGAAAQGGTTSRPVRMELIRHGKLYLVVLLSNPPYGIDWAPCGNFALVKKTASRAEDAGVRKGSIIAKITGGKGTDMDLHEVDHTLAATLLRNLFEHRREILLTLCVPPSEARTGHFERLQDARNDPKHAATGQAADHHSSSSSSQNTSGRPSVVAEHDGVEVRVHPLLHNGGGSSSSRELRPSLSSAATSLSQLAFRVAAGELFSFPSQHPSSRSCYSSQRSFRPCPPMDTTLAEAWSSDTALAFLLHYQTANYDVQRTLVPAMESRRSTDGDDTVLAFFRAGRGLDRSIDAFLLQILATIQRGGIPRADELAKCLVDHASRNSSSADAAYRMELVAQALGLAGLKEALAAARKRHHPKDEAAQVVAIRKRHPRQIPIRVERVPDGGSSSSPVAEPSEARSQATAATTSLPSAPARKERRKRFGGFFRRKKKNSAKDPAGSPKKNRGRRRGAPDDRTGASNDAESAHTAEQPRPREAPAKSLPPSSVTPRAVVDSRPIKDPLFVNTLSFIEELESVCGDIEKSLLRSFSQKIAGWALQPWSPGKETELAQVTQVMRERLKQCRTLPILNPIDSQPLVSIDAEGCYILPSAHFPLLLTFDYLEEKASVAPPSSSSSSVARTVFGEEKLYRTRVELLTLDGSALEPNEHGRVFFVQGSVGGSIVGSGPSIGTNRSSNRHVWDHDNVLTFDGRSSWGAPKTLSLRITEESDQIVGADENGKLEYEKEIGYCFVNIEPLWQELPGDGKEVVTRSFTSTAWSSRSMNQFDDHGDLPEDCSQFAPEGIAVQMKVTIQALPLTSNRNGARSKKRSLLYKHDDDVRQEMFAIEFVKSCESILTACGLDLRLLTFGCIPVGERRGFIEWVNGSVPLSEICQPFAGSILDGPKKDAPRSTTPNSNDSAEDDPLSSVAKAGLTKYESLRRFKTGPSSTKKNRQNESSPVNPVQDFLRAFAFDPKDPFMIQRSVMENYVKSCAGYCVITYILGVGDRHLDNLLLHPTGHFFHCDYSFILGNDPKKHLPLRITQDMVNGMGGPKSDNYAMFLSLTCAAFLTLRRPENVRHLLSFVRLMEGCSLPDIGAQQSLETATMGLRDRLRLDLSEEEAISFMEKLIQESCSSRMWLAVDAIHTLGKRF